MNVHPQLVSITHNAWRLVWAQRRVVESMLPLGSAMMLAGAALVILNQSDNPLQHFQLVCELLLPLANMASTAYLFSPESDPPLELLYTCPCSIPALLSARLVWLAGTVVLLISTVQGVFLVAQSSLQPHYLWLLIQTWVPPTVCLSGLSLLVAQLARNAQAGVLSGVAVWILQMLILDQIFLENDVLESFYLFPVYANLPPDDMMLHRWFLLGLGLTFFVAGFVIAHKSQRHWNIE